jgi:elongation factor Ts
MSEITATPEKVKSLRQDTGMGFAECRKALVEAAGDAEGAKEWLRKRGADFAALRGSREATEGTVHSYIHPGGRVGVLVEVRCESDFVARGEVFQTLCHDLAMHIAAAAPEYLSEEDIDDVTFAKERRFYWEQVTEDPKMSQKPAEMIEKIVMGKYGKWLDGVCLLRQKFIKDESKKIQDLIVEATAQTGEKIEVKKFARFAI